MKPMDNKELIVSQTSRRKFLQRTALGSLPVLLTLKSKAAWGTSTLNCSLSENASQMQSVQPEKFAECQRSFDSHGSAKLYLENKKSRVGGGKGGYFYKPASTPIAAWSKSWNGINIYQDTLFSQIFNGSYSGTFKDAVNQGGDYALIRNITAVFLHALYYQMTGQSTNIPSPAEIVSAYVNSVTQAQKDQLAALLVFYIDGSS
ncbi:hypothetical protein [Rheinheimera salexigens]|uniref:Uncharacterized protein n=1 Tax=Rheinheimera salexigens TaxID=1628148 RepID=A0A1E7Q950_9GAMM|nr:hypothetical protein [Rheinheimera salexigens]OEY70677.1 hypothetical protein BI198_14725 [Rheinheimera salexigens]